MYHRAQTVYDKPYQTTDLFSLRKKTTQTLATFTSNRLMLSTSNEAMTLLSVLGFYNLLAGKQLNEDVFVGFGFEQCPKSYQTFAHDKTMKVLLKVAVERLESESLLADLANQFPIFGFVLDSYARAVCSSFVKTAKNIQLSDFQKDLIQNFSYEPRGNLLAVFADSLNIHLTLTINETVQSYGLESNPTKLQISYTSTTIEAQQISKRPYPAYTKIHESNLKSMKQFTSLQTQTSQSNQVSSIGDNNSMLKDNIAVSQILKCQRCKMHKNRCFCSKKVVNSGYETPKSGAKYERGQNGLPVNANNSNLFNINVNSNGKCTCHKIFCTCKR